MLPAKNWWTIRNRFKQSVPNTVSKNYLATVLDISEKAAGNVLPALKLLGLINEENRTTDRANHWRVDTEYQSVCEQIINEVYPEELTHAVPDPTADFGIAARWFMREAGVGEKAARGMARFYQLLKKADLSDGEGISTNKSSAKQKKSKASKQAEPSPKKDTSTPETEAKKPVVAEPPMKPKGAPTLHIDVQVHISPESSPEQIDTIFASMAKHLYKRS